MSRGGRRLGCEKPSGGDSERFADPWDDKEGRQDAVERFLADKRILLVLDNAEHVLPAAAELVAGLIASCRALSVLATSRAPLSLAGERCWPVAPLKLPDRDADPDRAAPCRCRRVVRRARPRSRSRV